MTASAQQNRRIPESRALEAALSAINARKYAWQDTLWENNLKRELEDRRATYFPEGKLVILPNSIHDNRMESHKFCYQFEIKVIAPKRESFVAWIDAQTGSVLGIQNSSTPNHGENVKPLPLPVFNCDPRTGTFNSLFNGNNRSFKTQYRWFYNNHSLEDCTREELLHTKIDGDGPSGNQSFWADENVTDYDNAWGSDDNDATTGHWALQKTYDYFFNIFNRNGTDNEGTHRTRLWVRSLGATELDAAFGNYEMDNGSDLIKTGTLNTITVQEIGFDKVSAITYHNLINHITESSTFMDSPIGSISAAINLFGECSNEEKQVRNAWAAVGIGAPADAICMDVSGTVTACVNPGGSHLPLTYTAFTTPANATITWDVLWNMSYTTNGHSMTITDVRGYGFFTFSATATSGNDSKTFPFTVFYIDCSCMSGGICEFAVTPNTTVSNNKKGQLTVHPNPATDKLTIELEGTWQDGDFKIMDILGREVKNINPNESRYFVIDVSDLEAGLYLIKGQTKGQSYSSKFQIIK